MSPLIYVEDKYKLGSWAYGCGLLFTYIYDQNQQHSIQEVVVPPMAEISRDQMRAWLKHPHAFFFRYSAELQWLDDSRAFRTFATKAIQPHTP